MRTIVSLLPALLAVAVSSCATGGGDPSSRAASLALDSGLEGWNYHLSESDVGMEDVWRVKDGVLVCKGVPLGYLYTEEDYTSFVLELEWRWPLGKKAGNGGVLLRMTGDHKIWPRSLEAQLNAGDAGDFWGLAGYPLSGPSERTRSLEHEKFGALTHVKKASALERPAGEWNHYEIVAAAGTVTLKINGQVVNRATGCAVEAGKICLTAEGDEIHFRNLRLTALNN